MVDLWPGNIGDVQGIDAALAAFDVLLESSVMAHEASRYREELSGRTYPLLAWCSSLGGFLLGA